MTVPSSRRSTSSRPTAPRTGRTARSSISYPGLTARSTTSTSARRGRGPHGPDGATHPIPPVQPGPRGLRVGHADVGHRSARRDLRQHRHERPRGPAVDLCLGLRRRRQLIPGRPGPHLHDGRQLHRSLDGVGRRGHLAVGPDPGHGGQPPVRHDRRPDERLDLPRRRRHRLQRIGRRRGGRADGRRRLLVAGDHAPRDARPSLLRAGRRRDRGLVRGAHHGP